jgi:3D (Asp-Asp-Asp) domain-containing protein
MRLLQNAYKTTVKDRKILAVLMVTFILTNSHITAVHAQEMDQMTAPGPDVVTTSSTDAFTAQSALEPVVEPQTQIPTQTLPVAQPKRDSAIRTVVASMTAYTSAPNQTDGTPYVTADGSCVSDGIVASNFLKIGTRVRFPDLFGDKIFEVHDRMNDRYTNRIDVWMKDIKDARQFGLKRNARVEIVMDGDNKKQWDLGLTNADCQEIALAVK